MIISFLTKALAVVSIAISFSCSSNKAQIRKPEGFKPPFIIQAFFNPDSIKAWSTDGINEVWPEFVGQYKFPDTVRIGESEKRSGTEEQFKWEYDENNFNSDTTLSSDGLQLYPDYNTTIIREWYPPNQFYTFFPLYIVNETKDPKLFIGKDGGGYAIQEAVDTSDHDRWYAIEAKGMDACGNGRFRRKLLPGEFIMILMPKYHERDTTYIRTRVRIGETILISKPYKGLISRKQFTIPPINTWLAGVTSAEAHQRVYYGAECKK